MMIYVLMGYYSFVNLILLLCMGVDKYKAKKHLWRVSEKILLTLSIIGGAVGGFVGMYLFRHKTKKYYFHFVFLISLIIHIYVIYRIFSY